MKKLISRIWAASTKQKALDVSALVASATGAIG